MTTIIIDDNNQAAQTLADKLRTYDEIEVTGIAANGKDGLTLIEQQQPDLIFLDVELPDISGIDFLERMNCRGHHSRIIMYTAYGHYMLPAFRNHAFDFLTKPIDDAELRTVIRRVCLTPHPVQPSPAPAAAMATAADGDGIQKGSDGKLLLYTNTMDFRLVDIRDIGIFSYNHELRLWEVYVSGTPSPVRLKRAVNSDALLAIDPNLMRVSQRHIINVTYLIEVTDNVCRFYPPFDKIADVRVGRFYRKKLIDRFCSL